MKVLLTTPSYPPFNSGLGNAVRQLAATLTRCGCQVVVATAGSQRGDRQDPELNLRIEEFRVQGAAFVFNPIRGKDVKAYKQFLIESRFDLFVLNAWQTWSTDIALQHLGEIRGRKMLYSHCVSTNTFMQPQPLRSLLRYLAWRPYWSRLGLWMRQIDGLVFLAETGCDARFDDVRLAKKLRIAFNVIPNALSFAASVTLDQPLMPRNARRQIVSVGSYEWQKGYDFVLRAYAQSNACNRIPLKILGQRYTPYTDTLRKLSKKLGILDSMVTFHEGVSESALIAEYRQSLVFISGSYTECQPLVLLDAMACGTPFIARATGCIPQLVGGISVRTEETAAQVLDTLLMHDEEWLRYAEAGRLEAYNTHHPDRVSEKLAAAFLKEGA